MVERKPNLRDGSWELADHMYWIKKALDRTHLLDFLSDRAQNSIIQHIAKKLHDAYADPEFLNTKVSHSLATYSAIIDHPLGRLFADTWAELVETAVTDFYVQLEDGRWPE